MNKTFAGALTALALQGCAPYVTRYLHLEAPGVAHVGAVCRSVGAPAIASFEREGYRLEVTLSPVGSRSEPFESLTLYAQPGTQVSMPTATGQVAGPDGAEQAIASFELRHRLRPRNPRIPPGAQVAPLDIHDYAFVGLPPLPAEGTLTLPAVVVNGVALNLPPLRFTRRVFVGVLPWNC